MAETTTGNDAVENDAPAKPKRVTKRKAVELHARSYLDAIGRRDVDAVGEHWREDGVEDLVPIGMLRGRQEIKDFFSSVFAAMPDAETTLVRVVAGEWRMSGMFSGAQFQGIDPTGKPVEVRGMDMLEIENGEIVSNTAYYDGMAFARQVGMFPPQDSGAERAMKGAFNALTKARKAITERTGGPEGAGA
jgi:ketosteroid isomerase-like protein